MSVSLESGALLGLRGAALGPSVAASSWSVTTRPAAIRARTPQTPSAPVVESAGAQSANETAAASVVTMARPLQVRAAVLRSVFTRDGPGAPTDVSSRTTSTYRPSPSDGVRRTTAPRRPSLSSTMARVRLPPAASRDRVRPSTPPRRSPSRRTRTRNLSRPSPKSTSRC